MRGSAIAGQRPDWVEALADACQSTSQRKTAKLIGYSATTVNQVLAGVYPGDLGAVERAVRRSLDAPVDCPELGAMALGECLGWQDRAASFVNSDPQRVAMYRACRGCSHFRERRA